MTTPHKTIEVKVERLIPATQEEVFDAWFNSAIPGNPWNLADKFLLDPKVDGLFYWSMKDNAHYGRFISLDRPVRIQKTWVSRSTHGEETTVTITLKQQGENTLMTLIHSNLPDTEGGRSHDKGWNYFLNIFPEQFGKAGQQK